MNSLMEDVYMNEIKLVPVKPTDDHLFIEIDPFGEYVGCASSVCFTKQL
jgi:hypothetical protein